MTEEPEDISPEVMAKLIAKLPELLPKILPEGVLEAAGDLAFLKGCVIEHIEKLKALSRKLPKEQFHTQIELASIVTQLEISLHITANEKAK